MHSIVFLTVLLLLPLETFPFALYHQNYQIKQSLLKLNSRNVMNLNNDNDSDNDASPLLKQNNNGIKNVKTIIAVSSCKGGVGKSTVAVNLAYTLKAANANVGIFDADIYGPSLPTMTGTINKNVIFDGNDIIPLQNKDVKLMSIGYISKGANIIRGPMVNQILNQMIFNTQWGELDYLIIDMPPGTGDIQLTLAQTLNIMGAIIVTTPQRLSFIDVVKGIDMFDSVNIPTIAVIENMAEIESYNFSNNFYDKLSDELFNFFKSKNDKKFLKNKNKNKNKIKFLLENYINQQKNYKRIFGQGYAKRLKEMWGIENFFSLPIIEEISKSGDDGYPHVLQYPTSITTNVMINIAETILKELKSLRKDNINSNNYYDYNEITNIISINNKNLKPILVRRSCKCALCVEELSGIPLLDPESIPKDIKPLGMAPIGRYAISIDWSDGHKSLMPFKLLDKLY